MFGSGWRIFRLLGIPVSLDTSWLIVLSLLTLSLANAFPGFVATYDPDASSQQPWWSYWLAGLFAAVAFFGCILLHELGHAVVARAYRMPVRGITLFLFGGVADIGDEPPSPKAELLVAVAGPVVSLFLAGLFGLIAWLTSLGGLPSLVVVALFYLAGINLLVLGFNLTPAYPLDGGRILRAALWASTGSLRKATRWGSTAGRIFSWALIVWGVLNFFGGNWLGGVWLVLIGMFLKAAAERGYVQVLVKQALHGEPVSRFLNPQPISVLPSLDLRAWVDDFVYRHHRKTFPVIEEGRLLGWIDTKVLAGIPRSQWDLHTVGEVMRRDLPAMTISPNADALDALARMQTSGNSRLLVVEGERLVGILSLKDLLRFFSLKIELEGDQGEKKTVVPTRQDEPVEPELVAGKR